MLKRVRHLLARLRFNILVALNLITPPLADVDTPSEPEAPVKRPSGRPPSGGARRDKPRPTPRSFLHNILRREPISDHPTLATLRRRAVNELFDWLGLTVIPRQVWPILARTGDPGETIMLFARSLGCDPDRLRRRDTDEIERLQGAIDLLIVLNDLAPAFDLEQRRELEVILFSGDYDTVTRYGRILFSLQSILHGFDRTKDLPLFAAYQSFKDEVTLYKHRPLELTPDDLEQALYLSDRFERSLLSYTNLNVEIEAQIDAALSSWPPDADDLDNRLLHGITARSSEIKMTLLRNNTLTIDEIEALVEECNTILNNIIELIHRVSGSFTSAGHDRAPDSRETELKEARIFLDLPLDSPLSFKDIKNAFRAFARTHHPDYAVDDTDSKRRNELMKKASYYMDLLRLDISSH